MSFFGSAWRILVGVKDALVLFAMLLFFGLIWAGLSYTPNPAATGSGALLIALDGTLVEQPAEVDPLALLMGSETGLREYRLRDVVRAIEGGARDASVKALVLDLDRFVGGGQVALDRVAEAVAAFRKSKKPVYAYATGYSDDAYRIAAAADEIWLEPMGAALFTGPGGSRLYYKGLIDRLGVNARVYRVGTYKSFVEPYTRTDQSPEAEQAQQALVDAIWANWQADVARARPRARLAGFVAAPDQAVIAANGDLAKAALAAGLVDTLGDRIAFGKHVAKVAGKDEAHGAAGFRAIPLDRWLAANAPSTGTSAIGVVTVAGSIVDGEADPGTAGGDTIARHILKGIADKPVKALVVRIDSGGGSALASEKVRLALIEAKRRGIPVVASMGNVAASGGYWIATAGDQIFADPSTITGSIGVFGLLPTFEGTLAKIGVNADGVTTTPLTGQPDLAAGTNATFDRLIQASIENNYRQFVGLVGAARKLPVERVDAIGQGRVWDGGTARQLGLVDRFGSLEDAIAEAARRAKVDPDTAYPLWLEKEPTAFERLLQSFVQPSPEQTAPARDLIARLHRRNLAQFTDALVAAQAMLDGPAVQARCLECPPVAIRGTIPARTAGFWGWLTRQ